MWRHLFIYYYYVTPFIYLFIIIIWRHLFIYYYYLTPFIYLLLLFDAVFLLYATFTSCQSLKKMESI